jgi:hypothetical protein
VFPNAVNMPIGKFPDGVNVPIGKSQVLKPSFILGQLAMGSVGDDYRCPLCGRTGMGGYSMDGVNFPVCTAGTYNCVDKISGGSWPTKIVANGLFAILGKRMPFSYEFVYEVADFLCHRP